MNSEEKLIEQIIQSKLSNITNQEKLFNSLRELSNNLGFNLVKKEIKSFQEKFHRPYDLKEFIQYNNVEHLNLSQFFKSIDFANNSFVVQFSLNGENFECYINNFLNRILLLEFDESFYLQFLTQLQLEYPSLLKDIQKIYQINVQLAQLIHQKTLDFSNFI